MAAPSALSAFFAVSTLALNAMLQPTDHPFGMSVSRSVSFINKSNPVFAAVLTTYNIFDLVDLIKSSDAKNPALKDFVVARTGDWGHGENTAVKHFSTNRHLRLLLVVTAVVQAARVFILPCPAGTRAMCAAYLAQYIIDVSVATYANKWNIKPAPQASNQTATTQKREFMMVLASSCSLLAMATAYFITAPQYQILKLWTTTSIIGGLADLTWMPGPYHLFLVPVFVTIAGIWWQLDFDYVLALGINLAIVNFLLDLFGIMRKLRDACGYLIYIGSVLAIGVACYSSAFDTVGSDDRTYGLGLYNVPRDAPWYSYIVLLLPGVGPVANTLLCFLFLWMIWRMMSGSPSQFIPT